MSESFSSTGMIINIAQLLNIRTFLQLHFFQQYKSPLDNQIDGGKSAGK